MRRREFIAGLGGAAAWPLVARGQRAALPTVGWLHAESPEAVRHQNIMPAFQHGLAETGYVEGRNVAIEYRWAEGNTERLPALAAELALRQVAVIVVVGTAATLAAKAATQTIPVVFLMGSDPIEIGLAASFNRPGGNLTGVAILAGEIAAKRLALLREFVPTASSMGMLVNPTNPLISQAETRDLQTAAHGLGLRVLVLNAGTESEVAVAFATLVEQRAGALLIGSDTFFVAARDQIILLAARHAVPTMFFESAHVSAGGLSSYGPNLPHEYQQIGLYAGRILKGEKPADLPIVQPTKFELVINLKTAKALGLTIPPNLLAIADEVIE
jgi:putative tryptophan/tyrosine transport system substrate-binding protein